MNSSVAMLQEITTRYRPLHLVSKKDIRTGGPLCENTCSSDSQSTAATEACSVDFSETGSLLHKAGGGRTSSIDPPGLRGILRRSGGSSANKRTRSNNRRLHFNHSVEQRTLLGRHQYSTEELDACWFRGDEYAEITRSCCKQIKRLEEGVMAKDQKYCSRGLESHTQLAALAKAQHRRAAWDAVLDEQDEQISLGVVDDEPISRRYLDASASSLLWARRLALGDQKEAELVYDHMLDEIDILHSSF